MGQLCLHSGYGLWYGWSGLPNSVIQYFGQNLGGLVVNDAIVAKRFVIRGLDFSKLCPLAQ